MVIIQDPCELTTNLSTYDGYEM